MRKKTALLVVMALLISSCPALVYAAGTDDVPEETQTSAAEKPEDNIVTTKHEVSIKGEEIPYTAEAGTIVLESGGKDCEIFYTAYIRDDVEDEKDRPITFAFNGGPGSSSYCIQFCMGPRRPEMDEIGYAKTLPADIIDNENSMLDMTDLVFIDPVGTGYSKAVNEEDLDDFLGYDNDIRTVGDFIRLYINRHKRWDSPKYIAGESYGTARAVGLCEYLTSVYSAYVNGLMLISTANDYSLIIGDYRIDTVYATYVPTFAADVWYHKKLSDEYLDMDLEEYLDVVRDFVESEYVPALFRGKRLQKAEKIEIAEKLSGYIGLSEEYILKHNIRVKLDDFNNELLRDENRKIGLYDGRISGPSGEGSSDGIDDDPSMSTVDIAFLSPYMDYVTNELEYETDRPFEPLSLEVNYRWTFPDSMGYLYQENVIAQCLNNNPFLKVWVLGGYYDGATPFYSAEYIYNHVFLNADREENLSFTYYPAGHMLYTDEASFNKFRKDAENWYEAD